MPAATHICLQQADPSKDSEDASICPISVECGLTRPRRSIDVSRLQDAEGQSKPSALGFSTSSTNTAGGASTGPVVAGISTQQQLDAVPVRMQLPGRSPAGPMSSETPAELLTPDGRLNMDAMMERPDCGQASQHGLGFGKMGSFKFARTPSSRGGLVGALGTTAESGRGPASALSATFSKTAAAASSRECQAPQLPEQLLQLTLACQLRDARLLQQLLAAGVKVGAALDVDGNTALHLVLLPLCNSAAVAAVHDGVRSQNDSTQQSKQGSHIQANREQQQQQQGSAGGAFSWLTGCFTGGSSSLAHSVASAEALPVLSPRLPAAAASAQLTMIAALLAAGADTNARCKARLTPVMLAARQLAAAANSSQANAACKVLEVVCKAGLLSKPDVNLKDAAGRTALAHVLLPAPTAACMDRSTVARLSMAAGGSMRSEPASAASAYQSAGRGALPHITADGSVSGKGAAGHGSAAAAAPHAAAAAALAAARVRAVQMLVHHGADLNAGDADGMTPLMHAAAQPGVTKELLIKMLELGANSRLLDNQRRSALTHAMIAQQLRLIPAVGAAGEEHRKQQQQQQIRSSCSCSHSNVSASAAAAMSGCTPVPGYYYATVGSKSGGPASVSGSAALECAACADSSACSNLPNKGKGLQPQLQQQQQQQGDVNGQSNAGNNNSSAASSSSEGGGSKPALLSSFSTKASPLPNHSSVLRALCAYGSLDLFPGSINTRFPGLHNYSQLHIAMRRGDLRAMQLLLAGGADVDALDCYGNSPLMYWPVAPSEPEEVALDLAAALLAQGADPNLHNNDGWTALDLACELSKLGKVLVKPAAVPVHALLVGYGATNSNAFLLQHRHQPTLMCMRTDSANSVLRRDSRSYDSLRALVPSSCGEPAMMPMSVLEDFSAHFGNEE